MERLGLYISVPFCRAKCTFCNFASGVYPASLMPLYVEAVLAQVRGARCWARSRELQVPERVDTVYLGGGTPSLLTPVLVRDLLAGLRAEFDIEPGAEITLETAPLQLEPATLEAAQAAGINRVSFGVQSFVDGEAQATGRTHTGQEALAEIERMRAAGVAHISADLIAGLPGQTGASWRLSLDALARASVDHASVYMFELDEDSRLGAEALAGGVRYGAGLLPHEDTVAEWYSSACEHLAAAGLAQYEISNFARPRGASRHNERYWLRRPYLGFGVDAHSMLRGSHGSAARFCVGEALDGFLAGESWDEPAWPTPRAELEEAWFLGLRRNAGVGLRLLREAHGPAVELYLPRVRELCRDGLLEEPEPGRIALTARGRLLSNAVFGELLAAGEMPEAAYAALP